MIARRNNKVVAAFLIGKESHTDNTVSTGRELFLFGNKIAEWRANGLYISTGGYSVYTRNGNEVKASNTTKVRLSDIPNVRISQAKSIIYLNGKEWDGEWIKVKGVKAPAIKAGGDIYVLGAEYKSNGGYSEPIYAIAGANDTGSYSDSPCPSDVRAAELADIRAHLRAAGIPVKEVVCETSNVFCVHVYLVPKVKDVERGRALVAEYLATHDTRLAYVVKGTVPSPVIALTIAPVPSFYDTLTPYLATAIAEGFCEGEGATEEEQIAAWQYLHDTGLAYSLQGWFGRQAQGLIEQGLISA